MRALTYIEIDVGYCALAYGVAPCAASIPETGAAKCFNSKRTCQDRDHYDEQDATLRFCRPASYLPASIEAIPSIENVTLSPGTISLGENLGTRATLTVIFRDHQSSDTGEGLDKYFAERAYNPFERGTFWGKFRARFPYLRGRALRWRSGVLSADGQTIEQDTTRHFLIESFDGPTPDGKYTLVAKDVLKLVDGDRAQAPLMNSGFLISSIASNASSLQLSPAGVGDEEYGIEGYLLIGGKEIVSYTRGAYQQNQNDAATKVMLHFDGANGSNAIVDVAAGASDPRVWTANGATLGTSVKKFGTAGLQLANNSISHAAHNDFNFGSLDWCIDFQFNPKGSSGLGYLCGQSVDGTGATSAWSIARTAGNVLQLMVWTSAVSTVTLTGTTTMSDSSTRHVEIKRVGNVLKLFVNGVQEGGNVALSLPVQSSVGPLSIGAFGGSATSRISAAMIDEFRVSVGLNAVGAARHSANFTPPSAEYPTQSLVTTTGDVVALTGRGLFGTDAASFNGQDRVQTVLRYSGKDAADIIFDLMTNYAGIDAAMIPISDWRAETAQFLRSRYGALICEPTSVATLIAEIVQQACLAIWWDDVAAIVRMQVLRAVVADAARFTPDNILEGSLRTKEQPDKRLSRVQVYFGRINPVKQLSDKDNYRSSALIVDEDAEEDYGGAVIKTIMSRWIPALGRTVADRLGVIQLARFRDPPRRVNFETLRFSNAEAQLGGGYRFEAQSVQDETGAQTNIPVQVVRLEQTEDRQKVEAEEILFNAPAEDLSTRSIIVDASIKNVNLRSAHDALYGEPLSGDTIICRILSGVVVGSVSTSLPAFNVGSWPAGVTVRLIVEGTIQGRGGDGGTGAYPFNFATSGSPGGPALYTRFAIELQLPSSGKIWSGGGGAGGGDKINNSSYGAAGGGGAGTDPGLGNNGSQPGTPTTGGAPAAAGPGGGLGGVGGGPGLPGANGQALVASAGLGGAAGYSIDGFSFVTQTVTGGDRRGPTAN